MCCWVYRNQCWILNWYYLAQGPPCHPLALELPMPIGQSSCHHQRSLSGILRGVGLMGSYSGTTDIQSNVRYLTEMNLYTINMWNTINSFHSVGTYIITTTNPDLISLVVLNCFIGIRYLQYLGILICCMAYLMVTREVGNPLAGLIRFSTLIFPDALFISVKAVSTASQFQLPGNTNDTVVQDLTICNVSNGSKSAVRFRVWVGTELQRLQQVLPHQNTNPHRIHSFLASSTL